MTYSRFRAWRKLSHCLSLRKQTNVPRLIKNAPLTPSVSPAKPAGPAVTSAKLANGLEIVVIPDHRAPVVTHMVWYRNGFG